MAYVLSNVASQLLCPAPTGRGH